MRSLYRSSFSRLCSKSWNSTGKIGRIGRHLAEKPDVEVTMCTDRLRSTMNKIYHVYLLNMDLLKAHTSVTFGRLTVYFIRGPVEQTGLESGGRTARPGDGPSPHMLFVHKRLFRRPVGQSVIKTHTPACAGWVSNLLRSFELFVFVAWRSA